MEGKRRFCPETSTRPVVAGAAGAQGGGAEDFLSFGCIAHDQEPTRETMDMDNEHGPFFCCFFFTTNSSRKTRGGRFQIFIATNEQIKK